MDNIMLIGLSKLPLRMNMYVHSCLACVSLCCSAVDWQPVKGVPDIDNEWDEMSESYMTVDQINAFGYKHSI